MTSQAISGVSKYEPLMRHGSLYFPFEWADPTRKTTTHVALPVLSQKSAQYSASTKMLMGVPGSGEGSSKTKGNPAAMSAVSVSFDPGPTIESFLNQLLFEGSAKKNEEVRRQLGKLIDNYSGSTSDLINVQQELKRLQENTPKNLEDIPAHESEIQSQISKQYEAAKRARAAASALVVKTSPYHCDKYHTKRRIDALGKRQLELVNKNANEFLKGTENLGLVTAQLLEISRKNTAEANLFIHYKKQYVEISALYSELKGLEPRIFDPATLEEQRKIAEDRLITLKAALDPKVKGIIQFVAASPIQIDTDWIAIQGGLDALLAETGFYFQTDVSIQAELKRLRLENPEEYLMKARWYRFKLISWNQMELAADVSREWMSAIPQDVVWNEVEDVVKTFVSAGGMADPSKLLEVRDSLRGWLKNEPKLTDSERFFARANLGYLGQETTLEAYQTYRLCHKLQPVEPIWEMMQALFEVSTLQWSNALERASSLPTEAAAYVRCKIYESQQSTYSFALDAGAYIFSNWVGPELRKLVESRNRGRALDLLDASVRVVTEPLIKNFMITQFSIESPVDPSKEPTGEGSLISTVSVICVVAQASMKSALDLLVTNETSRKRYRERFERPASLGIELTGMSAKAIMLAMGRKGMSIDTLLNAGSIFVPFIIHASESLAGDKIGPDTRAMLRTAQKISTDLPLVNLLVRGGSVVASFGRGLAKDFVNQQFASALEGAALQSLEFLASPLTQLCGVVAFRAIFDGSDIRAATTIEEIRRSQVAKNKQKVEELQREASNWWFGNKNVVVQYAACLDFFDFVPIANTADFQTLERMNRLLPNVEQVLETLAPSDYFSSIREDLLYNKVVYFLSIDHPSNYAQVKKILDAEKMNSRFYGRLIEFILLRAEVLSRDNFELAENFLRQSQGIFPDPAYNHMIVAYKEYIIVRKTKPLTLTSSLEEVNAWLRAIDSVRLLIFPFEDLSQLRRSLQREMISQYLALHRYSDVAALLDTFGDQDVAQKYRPCLDFLNLAIRFNPTDNEAREKMNRLLPNVDLVLRGIASDEYYSLIRDELLFRKVVFYLSIDNPLNYIHAKTSIEIEGVNPNVSARLVFFIISRAELMSAENLQTAEKFLTQSEQIFPDPTYNRVIAAYKEYVILRKRIPYLTANSSIVEINAWLRAVDDLRILVTPIKELSELKNSLQVVMVNQFQALKRYGEVAAFLVTFGDRAVAEKYNPCLEFFKLADGLKPGDNETRERMNRLLPSVDRALEALKTLDYAASIRDDLLYNKVVLYLAFTVQANHDVVKVILKGEPNNSRVNERLIFYLFNRAEELASQQSNEAVKLLEMSEGMFHDNAYDDILGAYKRYIYCKKKHPNLSPESAEEAIVEVVNSTDGILDLLKTKDAYKGLSKALQIRKAILFVETKKFTKAKDYLKIPELRPEVDDLILSSLAGNALAIQDKPAEAMAYLTQALEALQGFSYAPIVRKFHACISENREKLASPQKTAAWIATVDSLLKDIEEIHSMSWIHEQLLVSKFFVLVNTKKYREAKEILDLPKIKTEKRLQHQTDMAVVLLFDGEVLRSKQGTRATIDHLNVIAFELGIQENKLIKQYLRVLADMSRCVAEKNDVEIHSMTIRSIDRLLQEKELNHHLIHRSLKRVKIDLYMKVGSLEKESRKILEAYRSAKELLLTEEVLDHDHIRIIHQQIVFLETRERAV